jgi:hypothetical protein
MMTVRRKAASFWLRTWDTYPSKFLPEDSFTASGLLPPANGGNHPGFTRTPPSEPVHTGGRDPI